MDTWRQSIKISHFSLIWKSNFQKIKHRPKFLYEHFFVRKKASTVNLKISILKGSPFALFSRLFQKPKIFRKHLPSENFGNMGLGQLENLKKFASFLRQINKIAKKLCFRFFLNRRLFGKKILCRNVICQVL